MLWKRNLKKIVRKIKVKKAKIYDIVLKILVVMALIILAIICIKYGKNRVNEKNGDAFFKADDLTPFQLYNSAKGIKSNIYYY